MPNSSLWYSHVVFLKIIFTDEHHPTAAGRTDSGSQHRCLLNFLFFSVFTLLPADNRYRSICCRTTGLQSSFPPQAVRLLNSSATLYNKIVIILQHMRYYSLHVIVHTMNLYPWYFTIRFFPMDFYLKFSLGGEIHWMIFFKPRQTK